MKLIQRISILITLLSANINYAQEFNGYKYFIIDNLMDSNDNYIKDYSEISEKVSDYFFKKKVLVLKNNKNESPRELNFNPCLGLLVRIVQIEKFLTLSFYNCKKEKIEAISGKGKYSPDALSQIFEGLDKMPSYSYDEKLTPFFEYPPVENINKNENELKGYFNSTKIDAIEGIYKTYQSDSNYKVGIFKDGDLYKAIVIESEYLQWKKGDVKAIFESTAAVGVFSTKFFMKDKTSIETFSNLEGGLLNIEIRNYKGENEDLKLLKLYPKD